MSVTSRSPSPLPTSMVAGDLEHRHLAQRHLHLAERRLLRGRVSAPVRHHRDDQQLILPGRQDISRGRRGAHGAVRWGNPSRLNRSGRPELRASRAAAVAVADAAGLHGRIASAVVFVEVVQR